MRKIHLCGLFLLLFVWLSYVGAIPRTINYQGKLTNSDGVAVDTAVTITFELYSSPIGGSPLWSETHTDVPVTKGLFDVVLGSITPFPDSLDFSEQYFLQLVLDGEALMPRIPFHSVPYALSAFQSNKTLVADSANWASHTSWDSIIGIPAGFADGIDDVGTISWDTLGAYWDTTHHFAPVESLGAYWDTTHNFVESDTLGAYWDTTNHFITPDTLGAYWDTTHHFAPLDTLGAYSDTSHNHNLSELNDVDTSGIHDGDVLVWNESAGRWESGSVSGEDNYVTGVEFDDGTNILTVTRSGTLSTLTTVINNEADDLSDNNLDDLGDVEITSPADGQVLTYSSASGKWIASTITIDWDTLGAYLDTTNKFMDAIIIAGDTTIKDTLVLRAGSGITFNRTRDTLTITAEGTGGTQKVVLQPQYPSVIFTNLGGFSNDSVWIRTYFDESSGNSFYQVSGAYGHDNQQYNIIALWRLPDDATSLDSIKIQYQTATELAGDNSVSFEIRRGGASVVTSGTLTSTSVAVWRTGSLSAFWPGDLVQIVALARSDSDKWTRVGKIEIYYH